MTSEFIKQTPEYQAQKRQEKLEKMQADQMQDDFRHVFCNPAGYRVLWHIFGFCGIGNAGFVSDPYRMYFDEGARSVGFDLLRVLEEIDRDVYLKVLKLGGERNG